MQVNVATRDFRLDTIKTIMILGIVVEHSLIVYGYPRSHELFWALMISWLMPMFTIISGYLYKQRKLKELLSKYLYPMFLFSAAIFALGFLFYDKYHEGINIIGYAMWYLWALFWFQIIIPPPYKGGLICRYSLHCLLRRCRYMQFFHCQSPLL